MFRASLRSVKDPLCEHVCASCLTRRFGGNGRLRQFSGSAAFRVESGGDASTADSQGPENRSLTGSAIPKQLNRFSETTKGASDGPAPEHNDKKPAAQEGESKTGEATEAPKKKKNRRERRIDEMKARKTTQKDEKKKERRETTPKGEKKKTKPGISKPDPETVEKELKDFLHGKLKVKKGEGHPIIAQLQARAQALEQEESQKSKTTTQADKENVRNLSFLLDKVHKKETGSLNQQEYPLTALDVETSEVPRLSFGLERVLFNPGVYHLRDPRSNVFNFDPYLGSIMPVTEFDFDALKDYITSSKDETLRGIAQKEKKKYVGSSSSMTSVLSQFHYLLSAWRGIDVRTLSQGFPDKLRTFTRLLRSPSAMFLRYQDGVYAIDADKEFDSANILMNLGKSMEKLLTLPKEEFERYRRTSSNKISPEEEQAVPESYHYSTLGDFIMRSQLDAYDPRLPGTGMFDLKTRAVVSIRMDAQNFEHGVGYEIRGQYGAFESYEREFFDMIRAAFLKYSLQVRVGRMDGIFVAFHNIERIFGFQYVSLPELDQTLHGQTDTALGDTEFRLSLGLWNKILDKATAKYPQRSLRFHFETRDAVTPFMYIFAEPVTEDEIHAIQTKNTDAINAYQQRVLNLPKNPSGESAGAAVNEESTDSSTADTADASSVDAAVAETATTEVNADASANAPEAAQTRETTEQLKASTANGQPQESTQSANAYDSSAPVDESLLSELKQESENAKEQGPEQPREPRELLAMTLTVKNFVNGQKVDRPNNFQATDEWTIDYELTELPADQALPLYDACQKRRQKALMGRGEDETDVAANVYIRKLREISKQGRKFREEQDAIDKEKGLVVLGEEDS